MRRIVSIWLPQWPIDRLRGAAARARLRGAVTGLRGSARKTLASSLLIERAEAQPSSASREKKPLALTTTVRNVQQLAAVNEAARAAGLSPGMTLTHARALLPDLPVAPADPDADRLALGRLADWCGRYSPLSGINRHDGLWGEGWFSGDDGLWIDITGCAHLFGGEEAMLADIDRRLTGFGLRHGLGLAGTLGAAWAIARFRPETPIVQPDELSKALADLPVVGLRLSPETVTLLKRLGLKRIGQLQNLPRAALGKRFASKDIGEALLLRLDQTFGERKEILHPRQPPPVYRTEQAFLEPVIELPGLAHTLPHLIRDLCGMLDKVGQGVMRLTLLAFRVDGDVRRLKVGASQPTRDAGHIGRLFAERLETIDPGFGIEKLVLHAERVGPLAPGQTSFTGRVSDEMVMDERLVQLVDRLANRLGPDAVTISVPVESHIPERQERAVPGGRDAPALTWKEWGEASGTPPRPSCLLLRPEPIKALAEVPDGPPLRFTWRRIIRRIVKAEGPERITGDAVGAADSVELASATRDYYRVEDDEGRRYWLFRQGLYDSSGSSKDNAEHQDNAVGRADQVSAVDRVHWFIHGLFG